VSYDSRCTEYLRDDHGVPLVEVNERAGRTYTLRCPNEVYEGVDPLWLELAAASGADWVGPAWPVPNPLALCEDHLLRYQAHATAITVDGADRLSSYFEESRAVAAIAVRLDFRRKAHHTLVPRLRGVLAVVSMPAPVPMPIVPPKPKKSRARGSAPGNPARARALDPAVHDVREEGASRILTDDEMCAKVVQAFDDALDPPAEHLDEIVCRIDAMRDAKDAVANEVSCGVQGYGPGQGVLGAGSPQALAALARLWTPEGSSRLPARVRCIALWQPYAGLLFGDGSVYGAPGPKRLETRKWAFPRLGEEGSSWDDQWMAIYATLGGAGSATAFKRLGKVAEAHREPRGAILGIVQIAGCRPMTPEDEAEALYPFDTELYVWEIGAAYLYDAPDATTLTRGPQNVVYIDREKILMRMRGPSGDRLVV